MVARVALIGCGPCGMSALYHFAEMPEDKRPEIVCFEKQSTWGGLWNYTWKTGICTFLIDQPLPSPYIFYYASISVHFLLINHFHLRTFHIDQTASISVHFLFINRFHLRTYLIDQPLPSPYISYSSTASISVHFLFINRFHLCTKIKNRIAPSF